VGCNADLLAAPEALFALMIDDSARRLQESRMATRDLALDIATFTWIRCPVPSRAEVPPGPDLRCLKFDGGAVVSCQ